jgi:hypothetical protein
MGLCRDLPAAGRAARSKEIGRGRDGRAKSAGDTGPETGRGRHDGERFGGAVTGRSAGAAVRRRGTPDRASGAAIRYVHLSTVRAAGASSAGVAGARAAGRVRFSEAAYPSRTSAGSYPEAEPLERGGGDGRGHRRRAGRLRACRASGARTWDLDRPESGEAGTPPRSPFTSVNAPDFGAVPVGGDGGLPGCRPACPGAASGWLRGSPARVPDSGLRTPLSGMPKAADARAPAAALRAGLRCPYSTRPFGNLGTPRGRTSAGIRGCCGPGNDRDH